MRLLRCLLVFLGLASANEIVRIGADDLCHEVNMYRADNNLHPIPFSTALMYVAEAHRRDLNANAPVSPCDMHSWSTNADVWSGCCFSDPVADGMCMWEKPAQLTKHWAEGAYTGAGFEISSRGCHSIYCAIDAWKRSYYHDQVLLSDKFHAMGCAHTGGGKHTVVWFGREEDAYGYNGCLPVLPPIPNDVEPIDLHRCFVDVGVNTSPPPRNTLAPTHRPTVQPTHPRTYLPTMQPTHSPTQQPTRLPTIHPTALPTHHPTIQPTALPTFMPSYGPTASPTRVPTLMPSFGPTFNPTWYPTHAPTGSPTSSPTIQPVPPNEPMQETMDPFASFMIAFSGAAFLVIMAYCIVTMYRARDRPPQEVRLRRRSQN